MNKQRRKEIDQITEAADNLASRIQAVMNEEQEYYDNMPEGIQGGEKGTAAEQALYALEAANEAVEELKTQLEEATQQ